MPPQPRVDARLSRFTILLDTLSEGERALDAAGRLVAEGDVRRAERELSRFLNDARPALERAGDLPAEYVDLLGQTMARALVARVAAWIELSFDQATSAEALRKAARADVAEAGSLPGAWLDARTRTMLGRLQRVLELSPA
jgi:hypothetical protein